MRGEEGVKREGDAAAAGAEVEDAKSLRGRRAGELAQVGEEQRGEVGCVGFCFGSMEAV